MLGHLVERARKLADLAGAVLLDAHVEVAGRELARALRRLLQRRGDRAREEDAEREDQQGRRS